MEAPDVLAIVDVPDHASAAAVSLAVNASGAVQLKTDGCSYKKSVGYRSPGK